MKKLAVKLKNTTDLPPPSRFESRPMAYLLHPCSSKTNQPGKRRKMLGKPGTKYPKAPVKWYVSAQAGSKEIDGVTKELSTRQAYICCSEPLRLKEVFDLVIASPERDIPIKAEVVWSNKYGYDDQITPRGMGVRFVEISEEDRRLIAEVVNEHDVVKIAADYLDSLKT